MINYVQKFAGGKVSIEVSDPADIYKLSTLYADGSEARVVDIDVGIYRLINGVWTYVSGSGGPQDAFGPMVATFAFEDSTLVCDKTYAEMLQAHNNDRLVVFHHPAYGNSIASYVESLNAFVGQFLYVDSNEMYIKELGVIMIGVTENGCVSSTVLMPRIPIPSPDDNGKVLAVKAGEYTLGAQN